MRCNGFRGYERLPAREAPYSDEVAQTTKLGEKILFSAICGVQRFVPIAPQGYRLIDVSRSRGEFWRSPVARGAFSYFHAAPPTGRRSRSSSAMSIFINRGPTR